MEEEARYLVPLRAQSNDLANQTRSRGHITPTTSCSAVRDIEFAAADLKSLKTQMISYRERQGPAKDPAEPEYQRRPGSSS
ncbi:hypothetical protein Tco_0052552 [Tanacetum coccineum]